MSKQPYHQARFMLSAAKVSQLPADLGYEVAFVGRSNSGKSSALNAITRQKNLARTSKTPGRTQLINLFEFDEDRRLVDLPGYGYAKVSATIKQGWQRTLSEYLQTRTSLKGMILLMDIRHPLQEMDIELLRWADAATLPVHVLLTKADKLRRGPALQVMKRVSSEIVTYNNKVTFQLFSVLTRIGLEECYQKLNQWFYEKTPT